MADSKISALAAVTTLSAADAFVVAVSGVSNKIATSDLRAVAQPDIAVIQHQQASGTPGGSSTSGSWQTCPLTTVVTDTGSNVTGPTSNHVVLAAGTYEVEAEQSLVLGGIGKLRLRNTTDSTTLVVGQNAYNNSAGGGGNGQNPTLRGVFTIAASKNLELQYWCNNSQINNGLGVAQTTGEVEVYCSVVLHRRS